MTSAEVLTITHLNAKSTAGGLTLIARGVTKDGDIGRRTVRNRPAGKVHPTGDNRIGVTIRSRKTHRPGGGQLPIHLPLAL